jgi:hypothetical protein
MEGEWVTWKINREERGGEGSVEMGEQVVMQSQCRIVSGGKGKATKRALTK